MRADFLRVVSCLFLAVGCAGSNATPDAPTAPPTDGTAVDVPDQVPGNPRLGAHALSFYRLGNNNTHVSDTSISTSAMNTQASGSTIVVSVGRGRIAAFDEPNAAPTDNKGNGPYTQIDQTRKYDIWPSGTALYASSSATGGANFQVSTATDDYDEITLAAVEVVDGTRIQSHSWKMAATAATVTSDSVTTTGPATLVAFWWGDAAEPNDKTAMPQDGFTLIDSILQEGALVQCAVAVKNVTTADTYTVSWRATPLQGAQLWLVAVQ